MNLGLFLTALWASADDVKCRTVNQVPVDFGLVSDIKDLHRMQLYPYVPTLALVASDRVGGLVVYGKAHGKDWNLVKNMSVNLRYAKDTGWSKEVFRPGAESQFVPLTEEPIVVNTTGRENIRTVGFVRSIGDRLILCPARAEDPRKTDLDTHIPLEALERREGRSIITKAFAPDCVRQHVIFEPTVVEGDKYEVKVISSDTPPGARAPTPISTTTVKLSRGESNHDETNFLDLKNKGTFTSDCAGVRRDFEAEVRAQLPVVEDKLNRANRCARR